LENACRHVAINREDLDEGEK